MGVVEECDSFSLEQFTLYAGAAKRKAFAEAPILEYDTVAGCCSAVCNRRRVVSQGKAYIARRLRSTHELRNEAVRSHSSSWNLPDDVEHSFRKISHGGSGLFAHELGEVSQGTGDVDLLRTYVGA